MENKMYQKGDRVKQGVIIEYDAKTKSYTVDRGYRISKIWAVNIKDYQYEPQKINT